MLGAHLRGEAIGRHIVVKVALRETILIHRCTKVFVTQIAALIYFLATMDDGLQDG